MFITSSLIEDKYETEVSKGTYTTKKKSNGTKDALVIGGCATLLTRVILELYSLKAGKYISLHASSNGKSLTLKFYNMKKILLILLVSIGIFSCSTSSDPIAETNNPPKEYIISLGLAGEITNIENSPLTKAVTNDLYGIQVYSMPTTGGEYKPYAYGLFDDVSSLQIKLLEGYKYKFSCTMLTDGKNKITQYNNTYSNPFYAYNGSNGIFLSISTSFVIGNYECSYLDRGNANLTIDSKEYDRPNIDRYYGETIDYTPADNSSVSINMKRVSFGAKIIAEGLTEGKLNITLNKAPSMVIPYPSTEVQDIFTFENPYPYGNTWTQDTYTETIPVSISWTKADGAVVPLVTQDITFTRNKLTTITVKVKDSSLSNGLSVSQESAEMGNGGSVVIDTSNSTDTPVNPS